MPASARRAPCTAPERADGYARRRPEETLLYAVVDEHWPRFLEKAEEHGGLPRVINWFTYGPVLLGERARKKATLAERRAHVHWVVDAWLDALERA